MTLATGTRLGSLEILGLLGVGGMGEVYRARDLRLERDVAVKVLPDAVAADAERVARFRREAHALAQLNHPNIAAIHGIEEFAGRQALVLELVEGPTLDEWIATRGRRHPPLQETLPVARQIAEALDAAHERGIVHRDLKPANIKISNDGRVKVLDFGIAKMQASAADTGPLPPTLTTLGTGAGVVLGTVAYMSPEQARGSAVDRRTDIWAFGCILFELLTATRAFAGGETAPDTLAQVLVGEPDWSALPATTPPRLRALLERCLQKEPKQRLRDIGDAFADLDYASYEAASETSPSQSRTREYAWAAVALAALIAAGTAARAPWRTRPADLPVAFAVEAPLRGQLDVGEPLSPDGRKLAFAAPSRDGAQMIFVRDLDSVTAEALAGTEGASNVFWSPDSQHLGFVSDGVLKRIAVTGGSVQVLCTLPDAFGTNGAAWGSSGTILIGTRGALLRVPAEGGEPVPASVVNVEAREQWHTGPDFLPDGRHFLFNAISGGFTQRQVYIGTLDSMERRPLAGVRSPARYSATGHVLFRRGEALVAQRFDSERLELSGEAFEAVERANGTGTAPFSVSVDGTLAYLASDTETELRWFDRSGKQLGEAGPRGRYLNPELSRDGTRIAVDRERQGNTDIHILDLARGVTERFTTDTAADYAPVWSPTSEAIMFTSYRDGKGRMYRRDLGASEDVLVQETTKEQRLQDLSSDGRYIVYAQEEPAGGDRPAHEDLWVLELGGQAAPIRVTDTVADDANARISPNGRWLAYESNESGALEVYVQGFPRPGPKRQVSAGGGLTPIWAPDSNELIYLTSDGWVIAAAVAASGTGIALTAPTRLFHADLAFTGVGRIANVAPDGRILLNVIPADRAPPAIVVVEDWAASVAGR